MVERRGTHEVLAIPHPKTPSPNTLMAGALRTQVDESEGLDIDALGDPAEHAGPMAVDAVPHHFPYEATNFLEAGDAVEFRHSDRHLVTAQLRNQGAPPRMDEPWLTGGGPEA